MAQRYIYLSDELNLKLKGEENASALISRLLNQHYENMQPMDLTAKMEEIEEMQKEIIVKSTMIEKIKEHQEVEKQTEEEKAIIKAKRDADTKRLRDAILSELSEEEQEKFIQEEFNAK